MKKPRIISMIKVNGEWMNQEDLPPEIVRPMVEATIIRAAANVGFTAARIQKEQSA